MPDSWEQIYTKSLNLGDCWRVREVVPPDEADIWEIGKGRVFVEVEWRGDKPVCCPDCGRQGGRYGVKKRQWRHMDTCQFQTWVRADVPRVKCETHGVKQVRVPWAEPRVSISLLFEVQLIRRLLRMPISGVAAEMHVGWDVIDGVIQRAVARGLARRNANAEVTALAVDETAFKKRHDYVTIVTDPTRGIVLYVGDSRKKEALSAFFATLREAQRRAVRVISMDMWAPYINATLEAIPDAREKIAFDRFHVAQLILRALNKVLRAERRSLARLGKDILTGTKYAWLRNHADKTHSEKLAFNKIRKETRGTSRAWAIKETARALWGYRSRYWALRGWLRLCGWMARSRLTPMVAAGKTIRRHLWGIINAVVLNANNGSAESMNSRIKSIKTKCRGFRNKHRFQQAILFHLGGLDLYPDKIR